MTDKAYSILNPFAGLLRVGAKPLFALRYYRNFHRMIQWKNPTLYYDKVFWLSMHTDTSQWSELTDKYAVRAYVEQRCGTNLLNQLYGLYDSVEDIKWDELPQQFVLKTYATYQKVQIDTFDISKSGNAVTFKTIRKDDIKLTRDEDFYDAENDTTYQVSRTYDAKTYTTVTINIDK